MSEFETDILMQLIRARYTCLTQLRDMGRRQLELIEARNVTALLDVLAAKQRPLGDIQRIERALDPFRTQDPELRRWRVPADRAACAHLVAQCDEMLREIVVQERRCEEQMTHQRDEIAVRLQKFRTAGQVHNAYVPLPSASVTQIDLFSET